MKMFLSPGSGLAGWLKYDYPFPLIGSIFVLPVAMLIYTLISEIERKRARMREKPEGMAFMLPLDNGFARKREAQVKSAERFDGARRRAPRRCV